MQWSELFDKEREPDQNQVREFVSSVLWDGLDGFLRQTYNVKPKLAYSGCKMDNGEWKGWNVKYKKNGRSLCTLYPKRGYFLLLMIVGKNELEEVEKHMQSCTVYTQNLFLSSALGSYGKSLAFEVRDDDVLEDVKNLILIRMKPKV